MTILERLKELQAKTTPGPWEVLPYSTESDYEISIGNNFIQKSDGIVQGWWVCSVGEGDGEITEESEANAELITLLHNNLPALLEVVEAMKLYVEHFGDPLKCARTVLAKLEAPADV